jgi:hypothetical protein
MNHTLLDIVLVCGVGLLMLRHLIQMDTFSATSAEKHIRERKARRYQEWKEQNGLR